MDAVIPCPEKAVVTPVRTLPARWLLHRHAARWITALATLLALPSLWSGLVADDYYHAARFLAPGLLPDVGGYSLFDLFAVSDGTSATNTRLVEQGLLPWWTDSQFRFQLWRPLAEASHWLDYRLWPSSPWLMHLHQLAWFAALQLVVLLFYRRLFPAQALGVLAFALFVLSANFSQTVTWLAARNTLMGATFGIAALLLHIKGWQEHRVSYRWQAVGLFALALGASEFGLGASTWLFAWVMVMESGSLAQRAGRLLPYGLVMGVWALIYKTGHYGVAQSEFYLDPLQNPAGYVLGLGQRSVDLLFSSLYGFSTGMLGAPTRSLTGWLIACGGVTLVIGLVWNRLQEPHFRFLLLGALLSLLPIAAGPGGARTLAFVSLGMVPFVAALLHRWMSGADRRTLTTGVAWVLVACLALGALARPATAYLMPEYDVTYIQAPAQQLPAHDSAPEPQRVILLNPSSVLHAILYPLARVQRALAPGAPTYPLASGVTPIALTRDGSNSLVLSPAEGFLTEPAAFFVRRKDQPLRQGDRFAFSGLQVEILSLNAARLPHQVRFTFDHPLESPHLQLLQCEHLRFTAFAIPAIGETVVLPACKR